nr:reverse transcriptase domain-containing protein [Tanacetum cinerariifolium]
SGGVDWRRGESGVKGMSGKPVRSATVLAILNVGEISYFGPFLPLAPQAGNLSYLIKELKQNHEKDQANIAKKGGNLRERQTAGEEDGTEGPMIIEAEMGGHCVHRIYMDGGSSSEILYEHCFSKFHPEIKNQLIPANAPLVGFSREIIWHLGQISLLVRISDEEHLTSAWMNFMVVRSPSPHNGIIGSPGVRKIRAIPSTAHGMIKFPVAGRIVTLQSSRIIPLECSMVLKPRVPRSSINQVREEKIQVAIHPEYPKQTVAIGSTLTEEGQKELCELLRHHLDVYVLETTRFSLRDQVSRYERLKEEIEELQDAQMNIVNDKAAKVDADLLEMALHLEEKFYPHILTKLMPSFNSIVRAFASLGHDLATKSDEFIKSSVEDLILIPSESVGIPEHKCDVPFHDISPPLDVSKNQFEDLFESNEEFSSTDDDSFSFDNIDYVEASPPDSELVSSEVMTIVILEVGGIKASNDNPIPFYDPIISGTPPNLTPSGKSYLDPEGDMLFLEAFLYDHHSSDFKTKSSSTSLNSLVEETNNFNNSLPEFTTFSKVLFDAEYESDSSDDQSCSNEDVLEKIVSKPLSEEEIIHMKSLRTYDSYLPISSKIDSLLDEFAGELTLLKSIPSGIDETDCDFEEDIRLIEKLLYDNSFLPPPKAFVSANYDAQIESFSPSPILVKDSDFLIEEIDLFCTPDYPMSSGIVDEDYDSERDILIPKDLPSNNTLSFAEKESFHFDIPLFSHPPAKPPDGDTEIFNIKMMGDIYDQKSFMHKLMITLASHQEKSPDLLSHRCGTVKKFNTHRSHLNKCPMMIPRQNNPILDVFLFHFYPLDSLKYGGIWSSSSTLKKRFVGGTPCLSF